MGFSGKKTAENNRYFLSPEQLAPIRNLTLRARLIVEGTMAGLHRSPYHGFSVEFLEYRPYRFGESTRSIDWRKYAKTDRAVTRLYEDETNLRASILFDTSGSMGFSSTAAMSKFEYGRSLCAALAWILVRQRDAVGLTLFKDAVTASLSPRSTNRHLQSILTALAGEEASRTTDCGGAIHLAAGTLKRRGMAILGSDVLDAEESVISALRHLRFKQQDVLLVRLVDPLEDKPVFGRARMLTDIETGEQLTCDPSVAAEHFYRGMTRHRKRISLACRELGIVYHEIRTDTAFHHALISLLQGKCTEI